MKIIVTTQEELRHMINEAVNEAMSKCKPQLIVQPPEEFLTRADVAKMFKVSLVTINQWSKKGILKNKYPSITKGGPAGRP